MKVIVVAGPRRHARTSNKRAQVLIVEVDDLDQPVLQKQANQFDRGLSVIDRVVPERAARGLARHAVLPDRSDVHLDALPVGSVLILDPIGQADVPNAELSVVDRLPLALNPEDTDSISGRAYCAR
jgi:hypothetical protein